MRKDEGARREWSLENVARCAQRQRRIVADAWDALAEGGFLVYSTCTFNNQENEDNVRWIVEELGAQEVCFENLPAGVVRNPVAGFNFYPHVARTEGFYVAVVHKASAAPWAREIKRKPTRIEERWTNNPLEVTIQGDHLVGYTDPVAEMVARLSSTKLYMTYAGIELGKEFHGELRPAHGLALAVDFRVGGEWPDAPLDHSAALNFLRCGAIEPKHLEMGINRVTTNGLGLGFVKRIGHRVNNLFPTAWRLLKS